MALNNVPLTGQSLGVTKVPINQNFAVIDSAFTVDHVSYNTTGQGWHQQVTFATSPNNPIPPVTSPPTTIGSNQFILYNTQPNTSDNAAYPVTLSSYELNIERQGSTYIIPITASNANVINGWAYLPSGILQKWSSFNATIGTTNSITFGTGAAIPAFNSNCYSVIVTCASSSTSIAVTFNVFNYSTTGFSIYVNGISGSGSIPFTYFAIGM